MAGDRVSERLESGTVANGSENDQDRVRIEWAPRESFGASLWIFGRRSNESCVLKYATSLVHFGSISRQSDGFSSAITIINIIIINFGGGGEK